MILKSLKNVIYVSEVYNKEFVLKVMYLLLSD